MKTTLVRASARPAVLLAALLATPFALSADPMGTAPTAPASGQVLSEPGAAASSDAIVGQDLNRTDAVTVRLNTRALADTIENADYPAREKAILFASRGTEEGRTITASLKAASMALPDSSREDVEQAVLKAEQARERLTQAIAKAQDSTEKRWGDVRGDLAERYEQYATLLETARKTAVDNGVKFEPRQNPVDRTRG